MELEKSKRKSMGILKRLDLKKKKTRAKGKRIKSYKIKITFGTLQQNMKYSNLRITLKFEIQYDRKDWASFHLV